MENALELVVTKNIVGQLETNIEQLEQFVDERLKEYTPDLYQGDAASAKKARAELNNSKKILSQKRIAIIKELMKPYEEFESRCKALERKIDEASGGLDRIVKAREEQEKEARRIRCVELWDSLNFSLVSMDKVFNPKWLNKSTKDYEILDEMRAITERIYADLKTIEKYGTDAETLKAHYLDCLDIGDTLDYGEELEKNRQKVREEAERREQRELRNRIDAQEAEVRNEFRAAAERADMDALADEALGGGSTEPVKAEPQVKEFVISVKCDEEKLTRLKAAMNALMIPYSVEEIQF